MSVVKESSTFDHKFNFDTTEDAADVITIWIAQTETLLTELVITKLK
jgi:hypothetical protein